MNERELLFSVTREDFELQKFRAGGKGGQGQNKRSVGVRLIHRPSSARGEARDERSFEQNRKNAFLRLINTSEFRSWHKKESARRLGHAVEIDDYIKETIRPENIVVEVKNSRGQWIVADVNYPWNDDDE